MSKGTLRETVVTAKNRQCGQKKTRDVLAYCSKRSWTVSRATGPYVIQSVSGTYSDFRLENESRIPEGSVSRLFLTKYLLL